MVRPKKHVPHGTLVDLGRVFQIRRLDLKLSLAEVEQKSKVSYVTISKLEQGKLLNTSIGTLINIARVLGMEIELTATIKK